MRNSILRLWKGEAGYLRWFLYPPLFFLSFIYKICLDMRERLYKKGIIKTVDVPIPVISVGNITLGGTGKTPLVAWLSERLKEAGFTPGIITRGYKRRRRGVFCVDPKADQASEVGDEALLLARRLKTPVIVGVDRAKAIELGISMFNIDLALIDDGFQLKGLRKDVEICLLNGKDNGEAGLFPAGPYREEKERIRDAHIILINKGEPDRVLKGYIEGMPSFRVRYRPMYLYNIKEDLIVHYRYLKGKRVVAFSGLGDNKSFFEMIDAIGAEIKEMIAFPDHYVYKTKDLKRLRAYNNMDAFVTTEKDAMKLRGMDVPPNTFYLAIDVDIEEKEGFLNLVSERLLLFGSPKQLQERDRLYKH